MKHGTIQSLTGLRFVAACMVFFSHFPIITQFHAIHLLCLSGYSSVTFFFILSGFVISYNHLDDFLNFNLITFWNYLIARLARIYPLYLFFILLFWFMNGAQTHITPYLLGLQAWSSHLGVAFGIGPAWSVSVELFLYALFPFLAYLVTKTKILATPPRIIMTLSFLVLILFSLPSYYYFAGKTTITWDNPYSSHRLLYLLPLTRSFDFMLGIVAAVIYRDYGDKLNTYHQAWSTVSYVTICVVIGIMSSSSIIYSDFSWDAIYVIPFFTLILSLAMNSDSFLSKFLSSSLMICWGEASYAFYLIHMKFMKTFYFHQLNSPIENAIYFLICFYLIMAIAYGLHKGIENPARRRLRLFLTINQRPHYPLNHDLIYTPKT